MSEFNIDNLQTFYWVVKLGSIMAAAERLGKSSPTISSHLRQLEEFYGVELFSRSKAGIKLTKQGAIIFKSITKPISELYDSKDLVSQDKAKGPLDILTFVGFGSQWLVKFLDGFLEAYPEINLNIDLKDISHSHYVDFDRYDVIIGPYYKDQPNIIQNELILTHLKLYASQEYIKKYGEPKTIEELANHRILGNYTTNFHDHTMVPYDWVFYSQKEDKIKPYLSINSTMALAKLCADGVGIAPIVHYQREITMHQLVPILEEIEYKEVMIFYSYRKGLEKIKRVTALYDYLIQRKKENLKKFMQPYSY